MKNKFTKFLACFSSIALAVSVFPSATLSFAEEIPPSASSYQAEPEETDIFSIGDNVNYESNIVLQNYERFEGCELEFRYKVEEVEGYGDGSCGEVLVDHLSETGFKNDEDIEDNRWLFSAFHAEKDSDGIYTLKMNIDSKRNPYNDYFEEDEYEHHQLDFRFNSPHVEILSAKVNGLEIPVNGLYSDGASSRETTVVEHIEDYAGKTLTATFETYMDFDSEEEMLKYFNCVQIGSWTDNWWNYQMGIGFIPNKYIDIVAEYVKPNTFKVELPVPELEADTDPEKPLFPEHLRKLVFYTPTAKMTGLTVNTTYKPEKTYKMYFKVNGGNNNSLVTKLDVKSGDEVKPLNLSWEDDVEIYSELNDGTLYRPGYRLTGFCTDKDCQHTRGSDEEGHICWAEYDDEGSLTGITSYTFSGDENITCYAQWEPQESQIKLMPLNGSCFADMDNNSIDYDIWLSGDIFSEKTIEEVIADCGVKVNPSDDNSNKVLAGFGYGKNLFDELSLQERPEYDESTDYTEFDEAYLVYKPDDTMGQIIKESIYANIGYFPLVPIWAASEADAQAMEQKSLDEYYEEPTPDDESATEEEWPEDDIGINVLYDVDGGKFITHNYDWIVENIVPEKTGYSFGGWYKDRNFTKPIDNFENDVYSLTCDDCKNLAKSDAHKIFIAYAKWDKNPADNPQYTIKFDSNGGTGSENDVNIDFQDNNYWTVTKPAITAPAKRSFLKWNTEPDGTGMSYKAGEMVPMTDAFASFANGDNEITLYAVWANSDISDGVENLNTVDVDGDKSLTDGDEFISLDIEPVKAVGESNAEAVKTELGNAVKNTGKNGCKDASLLSAFEASLKKYDKNGENGSALNKLEKDVEITIDIGYVPAGKIPFAMHMLADGTVERCKTEFDGISHKLKIKTRSFSPYVIATADRPVVYFYAPEPGSDTISINAMLRKETVNDTGIIGEIDEPEKERCSFRGWYISENNKITDSDKPFDPENDYVTMDLNVYAKWDYTHVLTHVEAVKADCVTDGNIEYWVCEDTICGCGKKYSDADGKTEVTDTAAGKAEGHKYVNGKCTVCNTADPDYKPSATTTAMAATTAESSVTTAKTVTTATTVSTAATAKATSSSVTIIIPITTTTTASAAVTAPASSASTASVIVTAAATTTTSATVPTAATAVSSISTTIVTITTTIPSTAATAAVTVPEVTAPTTTTAVTSYAETSIPAVTAITASMTVPAATATVSATETTIITTTITTTTTTTTATTVTTTVTTVLTTMTTSTNETTIPTSATSNITTEPIVTTTVIATDNDNYFATISDMCEMAIKDYTDKTQIAPAKAEAFENENATISIILSDKNGKLLAEYVINPLTGTGYSSDGLMINLPQTGNNAPANLLIAVSAAILTVAGAFVIMKSGVLRRRKEGE